MSGHRGRSKGNVQRRETKNGSVSWCVRYRANGRRIFEVVGNSEDGTSRRTAEDFLSNRLAEIRLGVWEDPRAARTPEPREDVPTLLEFASAWIRNRGISVTEEGERIVVDASRADVNQSTAENMYRSIARLSLFFSDAGRPRRSWRLDEIRVADVDRFLRWRTDQGVKRATAKRDAVILAQLLDLGVEHGYIERNTATGPVKRWKVEKARPSALDHAAQIEDLLDAAGSLDEDPHRVTRHRRAFIATLVFAGLRIGEAVNLRWRDVDLANGVVRVTESKTEAGTGREIDLLPRLRDELASLKARVDPRQDAWVFPATTGAKQGVRNARGRWFQDALDLANERREYEGRDALPKITPHGLRRTYASLLVAIGTDVGHVADQMGHTDPAFTIGVYRRAMRRRDGEQERMTALVLGDPNGVSTGASFLRGVDVG